VDWQSLPFGAECEIAFHMHQVTPSEGPGTTTATEKALADETKLITELPYSDREAHVTQVGFESGKPDVIGSGDTATLSLQQN